jgi:hypothetical protein
VPAAAPIIAIDVAVVDQDASPIDESPVVLMDPDEEDTEEE